MINLTDVLDWGNIDVEFLNNRIDEFEINTDDIVGEIESMGGDKTEINSWIYSTFYIAANNFLDKVEEFADARELEFERNNVEIDIFCNYLDSFLNGKVLNSDIDIMDYSDENLKSFIDKVNE